MHAASGAVGTLSVGDQHVGVKAVLQPVSYRCDIALDTGASVTGVAPALNLHWDASDPKWSSATWINDALTFTWQVTGQVVVGQSNYSIAVSFADQQTETPWTPGMGDISALLDANYDFTMTLAGGDNPPVNDRSKLPSPASGIASVFPYVLGFTVSNDGSEDYRRVADRTGKSDRNGTGSARDGGQPVGGGSLFDLRRDWHSRRHRHVWRPPSHQRHTDRDLLADRKPADLEWVDGGPATAGNRRAGVQRRRGAVPRHAGRHHRAPASPGAGRAAVFWNGS
jgi:hypothetical protein